MRLKRVLENVLLMCGLTLLLVYLGILADSAMESQALLRRFEETRAAARPATSAQTVSRMTADFSQWSAKRVKGYEQSLDAVIDPPLAVLRIPKIGLEVPVLKGTDEVALNRGVGWIEGTAVPGGAGNIGIAGHRDGFFRGLKDIVRGDRLELQTYGGTEAFRVDEIEIVGPKDSSVLRGRRSPSLTLVTCYPFYFIGAAPRRYIVHATLDTPGPSDPTDPRAVTHQAYPKHHQEGAK